MIVTIDDIAYYFNYCNREFFNNELPVPGFEVLHSYRYCAYFHADRAWNDEDISNPIIYISDYWNYSKKLVINLMCHEMIHYYLALNHIDMKGTHGKEFKKMARKLNKQHKLHIKEIVPNKLRRNKNAPILSYWWYRLFNWS